MLSKAKMAVLLGTMATALSLGAIGSAYAAEEQAPAADKVSLAPDKADFGKMKPGHKKGFGFGVAKKNAELLTLLLEISRFRSLTPTGSHVTFKVT